MNPKNMQWTERCPVGEEKPRKRERLNRRIAHYVGKGHTKARARQLAKESLKGS